MTAPLPSTPVQPPSSPVGRLIAALCITILVIVGFSLYTAREIGRLRDEQAALSERNRLDALQIVRIQQNLASLAGALRDMVEGTEPYPMAAWGNTFERLRFDLEQAFVREQELAPVGRPVAERAQLEAANARFWEAIDRALAEAKGGNEAAAAALVRGPATQRHAELVNLVSQLFIRNTRVDDEAATRARAIYDEVAREIYVLAAALVAVVALGGFVLIRATRRTFEAVQTLSAERRALSWRVLRMQEDLQTTIARELHDEFGQILTALGTMLGRIARKCRGTPWRALAPTEEEPPAPAPEQELRNSGTQELWKSESAGPGARSLEPGATNAPSVSPEPDTGAPPDTLVADLEEVRQLAQKTLDRIRTQSRMLHPVILDDFGLEHAVKWYVDEFSRQHGVAASYATEGALGALPSETAVHLYRIVQEALTNVARHARAGRAAVRLSKGDGEVVLEVEDNGVGLPLDSGPGARAASSSIGVTSMRERAELMGGSFALGRPESGQGVLVRVRVPLEKGQLS